MQKLDCYLWAVATFAIVHFYSMHRSVLFDNNNAVGTSGSSGNGKAEPIIRMNDHSGIIDDDHKKGGTRNNNGSDNGDNKNNENENNEIDAAAAADAYDDDDDVDVENRWDANGLNETTSLTVYSVTETKNRLCNELLLVNQNKKNSKQQKKVALTLNFSCHELYTKSDFGSGNHMLGFYLLRQIALASGNIKVKLTCPDAAEHRRDLIIPWVMGTFGRLRRSKNNTTDELNIAAIGRLLPPPERACDGTNEKPYSLSAMVPYIKYELRRMAIAAVGVVPPSGEDDQHPSSQFLEQHRNRHHNKMQLEIPVDAEPYYPGVELDEVAVHFRCGDIIALKVTGMTFPKFSGYASFIPDNVTSIGIITQSFETSSTTSKTTTTSSSSSSSSSFGVSRAKDNVGSNGERCKRVVLSFVTYLEKRFPKARVKIRNGHNETVVLAYSRMIMAKVAVASESSFSVFPAIANFYDNGYMNLPSYAGKPANFFPIDFRDSKRYDYPGLTLKKLPLIPSQKVPYLYKRANRTDNLFLQWLNRDDICFVWRGRHLYRPFCNQTGF